MANIINLSLRALQFLLTLIILALTGNMIHDAIGGNPSIVNYCMFVAVVSMLSLIYSVAVTVNPAFSFVPQLPIAVDALNTLFFFIGGIALASYLGVHSCGDNDYVNSNAVTSGSNDNTKRCHEGQAVCAFLWFGFAAYAASLVFSALEGRSSGASRGNPFGRSGGRPPMSQA